MKNYYARGRVGTDSIHYVGFTLNISAKNIRQAKTMVKKLAMIEYKKCFRKTPKEVIDINVEPSLFKGHHEGYDIVLYEFESRASGIFASPIPKYMYGKKVI